MCVCVCVHTRACVRCTQGAVDGVPFKDDNNDVTVCVRVYYHQLTGDVCVFGKYCTYGVSGPCTLHSQLVTLVLHCLDSTSPAELPRELSR